MLHQYKACCRCYLTQIWLITSRSLLKLYPCKNMQTSLHLCMCVWLRRRWRLFRWSTFHFFSYNTPQQLRPILTSQTHLFSFMKWCQNSMATTLLVAWGLPEKQKTAKNCWCTTNVSKLVFFTWRISTETLWRVPAEYDNVKLKQLYCTYSIHLLKLMPHLSSIHCGF